MITAVDNGDHQDAKVKEFDGAFDEVEEVKKPY